MTFREVAIGSSFLLGEVEVGNVPRTKVDETSHRDLFDANDVVQVPETELDQEVMPIGPVFDLGIRNYEHRPSARSGNQGAEPIDEQDGCVLVGPRPVVDQIRVQIEIDISRETIHAAVIQYLREQGILKEGTVSSLLFFDNTQHCVILGGATLSLRHTTKF